MVIKLKLEKRHNEAIVFYQGMIRSLAKKAKIDPDLPPQMGEAITKELNKLVGHLMTWHHNLLGED
jgi:hypothetical protein